MILQASKNIMPIIHINNFGFADTSHIKALEILPVINKIYPLFSSINGY